MKHYLPNSLLICQGHPDDVWAYLNSQFRRPPQIARDTTQASAFLEAGLDVVMMTVPPDVWLEHIRRAGFAVEIHLIGEA